MPQHLTSPPWQGNVRALPMLVTILRALRARLDLNFMGTYRFGCCGRVRACAVVPCALQLCALVRVRRSAISTPLTLSPLPLPPVAGTLDDILDGMGWGAGGQIDEGRLDEGS
jgi:hypothetical protein